MLAASAWMIAAGVLGSGGGSGFLEDDPPRLQPDVKRRVHVGVRPLSAQTHDYPPRAGAPRFPPLHRVCCLQEHHPCPPPAPGFLAVPADSRPFRKAEVSTFPVEVPGPACHGVVPRDPPWPWHQARREPALDPECLGVIFAAAFPAAAEFVVHIDPQQIADDERRCDLRFDTGARARAAVGARPRRRQRRHRPPDRGPEIQPDRRSHRPPW
jgi:hypothetical protein